MLPSGKAQDFDSCNSGSNPLIPATKIMDKDYTTKDKPRVQFLNRGLKRKVCWYCGDKYYSNDSPRFCSRRCESLYEKERS